VFFGVASFFVGGLLSPLYFLRLSIFRWRSFEPLAFFGVASFFVGDLLSPLHFLGLPLFCRRSFQPKSVGSDGAPSLCIGCCRLFGKPWLIVAF
jgi:hypothetical protein